MLRRGTAALVLAALILPACYQADDDGAVLPAIAAWIIEASGGSATASDGSSDGIGGPGGYVGLISRSQMSLGFEPTPAAATPPAPPDGGTTITTLDNIDPLIPGTVRISGSVTTSGAGSVTLTSTGGDIVVSGSLLAENLGGSMASITLNASNGTIYVTGRISTAGTLDGDDAGNIVFNARRIVVTGTLDASGAASTMTGGGNANTIELNAEATDLWVSGSLLVNGGAGIGSGGDAGYVEFDSYNGRVFFSGSVAGRGGAGGDATPPLGNVSAGAGGFLNIFADSRVELLGSIDFPGGDAVSGDVDAFGGDGGGLFVEDTNSVFAYGTMNFNGGRARATSGTIEGGDGGGVQMANFGGGASPLNSLQGGTPAFRVNGGDGGNSGAAGGDMMFSVYTARGRFTGLFESKGGHGIAADSSAGGGGLISFRPPGNGNGNGEPRQYEFIAPISMTADGGRGTGNGDGGPGGTLNIRASGDLILDGVLSAAGGPAADGNAGDGGVLIMEILAWDTGDIRLAGSLSAPGGFSSNGDGGDGGFALIVTDGNGGSVDTNAVFDLSGGAGGTGGGDGGFVQIGTDQGPIAGAGTFLLRGGSTTMNAGGLGGFLDVDTGSSTGSEIRWQAVVDATGGDGVTGGDGGLVRFTANSPGDPVLVDASATTYLDGGRAIDILFGGLGGTFEVLSPSGAAVVLANTVYARGGTSVSGTGGTGGLLRVISNNGSITTAPGSFFDLSGATGGFIGGPARNDTLSPGATSGLAAVELDADPADLAAPSGGTVIHGGTIRAISNNTVAAGGDVLFDGNDGAGGAPLEGIQIRTGTPDGDYDNDVP